MQDSLINDVRAIVADTYLAYTSDLHGAVAFIRFVSNPKSCKDVRREPKFSAFTDEELLDEMFLLERDIHVTFRRYAMTFN